MSYKIIFMGTPQFSVPVLESLAKSSYQISCVYTQSPKKSKRGQKLNPSPIQCSAENLKLVIRNPNNLNTEDELKFFKEMKSDKKNIDIAFSIHIKTEQSKLQKVLA